MSINYLKIGKATDLNGGDKILYRFLEILPGFLSWGTLIFLSIMSYFNPIAVAYFVIVFDVYWLLLVIYLGIHLLVAYRRMVRNTKIDWMHRCEMLKNNGIKNISIKDCNKNIGENCLANNGVKWDDIVHLIIFPTYNEDFSLVWSSFNSLVKNGYPTDKMIVILALEKRAGEDAIEIGRKIELEFRDKFKYFLITVHPDKEGELKGKGANQRYAIQQARREIIDKYNINYKNIVVSVFDVDTMANFGYFACLTYKFLSVNNPYRASYQPIPVYHNNVWSAPFFARIAASSNTFWQMMQQVRYEKLATYSSHSMTWQALVDIDFWSPNMVSEDSRIFWNSLMFYNGDYRVEPLYFPVSMDVTMDKNFLNTAKSLYKQQRRWGWGVENVPYMIFNTIKRWKKLPKRDMLGKIFIQIYGFHSWATNALIIGVIGWLPVIIGSGGFNSSVLSSNLPQITRILMNIAMSGLFFSAIISTLLLPKRRNKKIWYKKIIMFVEWLILPIVIVFFGAIPAIEAQTRLMLGKYLGFWVTPKSR